MTELKRTLGLPALVYYGVGTIVGAGIYSIIGAAAGQAGEALWVTFILAAVVATLSALSYAELVSAVPRVGGEYAFLRRTFPDQQWVSFTGGFIVTLAGGATAATVAIAFGGYLSLFVAIPHWISATVLLGACTVVNILGIRQSTWVNIVLTSIQVLGLVIVVVAGVSVGDITKPLTATPKLGAITATALVFFVYTGFESMVNFVEEAKEPTRDLPRSLLLAIAITAVIYLLVALSVVTLADPAELGKSDSPLSYAAGQAHDSLSTALAWFALCATATTALITCISMSRLLFGMARDGELPAPVAKLLPRRRTPWVGALIIFVVSVALLPAGGVETVASIASLTTVAAFVGIHICLIKLRITEPGLDRPFRVPWAIRGVSVLTVLGIVAAVGLATQFSWVVYAYSTASIVVGAVLYFAVVRPNTPEKPARSETEADGTDEPRS